MIHSIPSLADPDIAADIARTRDDRVCVRIRHHFVGVPGIIVPVEAVYAALEGGDHWIEDDTIAHGHTLWVGRRANAVTFEVRCGFEDHGLPRASFNRAAVLDAIGPRPAAP